MCYSYKSTAWQMTLYIVPEYAFSTVKLTSFFLSESPLEEVTNAMYDKTRKFAMTHDIQLKLPKMMFDGAILRISPQSFEGNGALVKIELEPDTRSLQESHGSPRFILKKMSKSRA